MDENGIKRMTTFHDNIIDIKNNSIFLEDGHVFDLDTHKTYYENFPYDKPKFQKTITRH